VRDWSQHGEAAFVFEVIEACPRDARLLEREYFHVYRLKSADPGFGYNKLGREIRYGLSDDVPQQLIEHFITSCRLARGE